MLKNFDLFCEGILNEGRESKDKKKFTVDLEKAKKHINDIGEKHHHYIHDKGHFSSLIDDINPDEVYDPETFEDHIVSCMKGKGRPTIAKAYAKLLYTFLNDRVDSPFEKHDPNAEVEEDKPEDIEDHEFSELPADQEIENA